MTEPSAFSLNHSAKVFVTLPSLPAIALSEISETVAVVPLLVENMILRASAMLSGLRKGVAEAITPLCQPVTGLPSTVMP